LSGLPIKSILSLGISGGIDKSTSFHWRHRFLTLPAAAKANHLEGVVEADETFFPVSCKGQRQLDQSPRKRGKQIHMRGAGKSQFTCCRTASRSRPEKSVSTVNEYIAKNKIEL